MDLIKKIEQENLREDQYDFNVGDTVRISYRIKEGEKERTQIFEGLVIGVNGRKGTNQTFTVRKVVSGVGVEKIFPIHSSNIEKIEVVKFAKIRRAKLYYMRERAGKSARLKETYIDANHEINAANRPAAVAKEAVAEPEMTEAEAPVVETTNEEAKAE